MKGLTVSDNTNGGQSGKPGWLGKFAKSEVVKSESEFAKIRDELTGFVEAAYEQWQKDKNSWQLIHFDSAEDRDNALAGAKWAASSRESGRLTVSAKTTPDPKALMFRVRDKVTRKRKGQDATADASSDDNGNDDNQDKLPGMEGADSGEGSD